MLTPLLLALRQLPDPDFLQPLLLGCLGAGLCFFGVASVAAWAVGSLAGGTGWLAGIAAALGGLLTLGLSIWLFVPVAVALAGLFLNTVAEAVERRFYPGLPLAAGASLLAQTRFNLVLALQVLALQLLALPLALLFPPAGPVLFWAVATIALGNGLFEAVAQRRMTVPAARALRRRRRLAVLLQGGVLAALSTFPVANLLVPVLGTAVMVHLFHRGGGTS